MADRTLFQKIIDGDIPADKVHEDDRCIAIRDINPQAPEHILIIPKKPIARLDQTTEEDAALLGHLLLVVRQLGRHEAFRKGYRVVINSGPDGGESVPHLHIHLLGGRPLTWPPG